MTRIPDGYHLLSHDEQRAIEEAARDEGAFRGAVLTWQALQDKRCRDTVRAFKANDEELFSRVGGLERWRAWALGGLAATPVVAAAIFGLLKFLRVIE